MSNAQLSRGIAAVAIAGALIALCLRSPRTGVVATLLFLPFLALTRRVLILAGGWASFDPLLLVAPLVAAFLVTRLFVVERRRLAPDALSAVVLALIALAAVHSVHPFGFGLKANLAGFMFLGLPLLWFFVGRELADRETLRSLLYGTLGIATLVAVYGLWQTEVGFPEWDERWIDVNGYNALYITAEVVRPFGTFASAAEYGSFLGVGIVLAIALGLHLRPALLLPVPLLVLMVFLVSSRGIFVIALTVAVGVLVLHTRGQWLRMAASVATFGVVVAGVVALGTAMHSSGPLPAHQLQGLANPLQEESSTVPLHWEQITEGFDEVLRRPFGQGTASTTIAAHTVGDARESKTSEFDLLDLFIALGFAGALAGLAAAVLVLRGSLGLYLARPGPETLACVGLAVATFGSWYNGGFYAIAPLVWFTVGWTSRCWAEHRSRSPRAV